MNGKSESGENIKTYIKSNASVLQKVDIRQVATVSTSGILIGLMLKSGPEVIKLYFNF